MSMLRNNQIEKPEPKVYLYLDYHPGFYSLPTISYIREFILPIGLIVKEKTLGKIASIKYKLL